MTFGRFFRDSLGVAALAGLTLAVPAFAQIQPYSPNDQYGSPAASQMSSESPYGGPPPGAQQDNTAPQQYSQQYGAPDQYGAPQQQYGVPQQYGAPEPGQPQGIGQAPPPIPDYEQPPAPGDGYVWTPGYWAWTDDGYQWVQGAWVAAPYSGALWTPGYWGDSYDGYFWNAGYWGPYVGYYGGINYGFGYFGIGYYGGFWRGGRFFYNRAYCNIGRGFRGGNFYNRPYNGYSGHPGGASFTHVNNEALHGGNFSGARGSTINGRAFAQTSSGRTATGGFSSQGRSNYGGTNYNAGSRNFTQPSQNRAGNYSGGDYHPAGGAGYSGGYHGASPSGGYRAAAPSGGGAGSHGSNSGGGGGGSHGGGGGGHR